MTLTLDMALRAAQAAQKKATDTGHSLTVSVVDAAGRLIVTLRGDGTGFFTTDTSRAKAVTAAAYKKSTRDLAAAQAQNPAFWSALPALLPGQILASSGAVPLFDKNNQLIGAIGTGGGTPEMDHDCAAAGAAAIA